VVLQYAHLNGFPFAGTTTELAAHAIEKGDKRTAERVKKVRQVLARSTNGESPAAPPRIVTESDCLGAMAT